MLFATDFVDGESLMNPVYVEPCGLNFETLSDEDPFGVTYLSPIERSLSERVEESSEWPVIDWSNDIEIFPGEAGTGQDFDVDEDTGDMYAIVDTDNDGTTTNDSIIVYRSQDNGATWTFWRATYSTNSEMNNPRIRVAKDAGGQAWVCMHYIAGTTSRIRRMTPDQSSSAYETVVADAVEFADMDADVGTGAYLYVVYVIDGTTTVRVCRNALDGAGFVDDANIYTNAGIVNTHPAVAAAAGGNAAVAFTHETGTVPEIRIKRTTNNGASWITSELVAPAGGWDDIYDIDVAFSRSGTTVGWITITFEFSTGDNFGYFLSTDSGLNWAWESTFGGADDENLGSIRARKSDGSVTVAYNHDPGDDVMFSWTPAVAPTSFTTPIAINEFPATGYWPATAGWNQTGNSAIIYADYTNNYRIMYDSYNNTGIDGTSEVFGEIIQNSPNPFSATTNISFTLTQSSPVTISVYNIAGQLVNTIADNQSFNEGSHSVQWDGQSFSPGVYFCRLDADGISQTHRMLMVR